MSGILTRYAADDDSLWPRVPLFRYRIYARVGRELTVLAACPEPGGIGAALVQIHDDQKSIGRRLADLGTIGVLDVIEGDWVVLPWGRTYD